MRTSFGPEVLGTAAFAAWAAGVAVLGVLDRSKLLLPTRLVHLTALAGGTLLAAGSALADDWHYLWRGIGCALAATTALGPYALLRPEKLGFGDVRMAALVSAGVGALSPPACFVAISTACFVAALFRRVLIVTGRAARDTAAPLGFFLAISGIAAVVASAS
jgi:leader peptidase (prepilin peptidase)/N-methyltransferase